MAEPACHLEAAASAEECGSLLTAANDMMTSRGGGGRYLSAISVGKRRDDRQTDGRTAVPICRCRHRRDRAFSVTTYSTAEFYIDKIVRCFGRD